MYVTTIKYDICLNGFMVGHGIPSRGLWQGDPLSPYLFLFCAEGLSDLLHKSAVEGGITGSQISVFSSAITHLLFADDSFLFFRANKEEATFVKALLNKYEKLSGHPVNFQKWGVFFQH